ncbi:MAG: SH3 domain-containing protein [Candidatus Omnitrophota bacterium]
MVRKLLIFAAVCWVGVEAIAAQDFPFNGQVTEDDINIRAGSNVNYESLFKAGRGMQLIVRGKSYNWYRVSLPEGSQCFISARYVKRLNADTGEVIVDRLNVRARPGESASILGQVKKGQTVTIRERLKDWLAIRPPENCFGWIHEKFVRFDSPYVAMVAAEPVLPPKQIAAAVPTVAAPAAFEVIGVVVPRGRLLFKRRGSHKLLIDKKPAYYLEGDRNLLDRFINLKVKINGTPEDSRSDLPLIKVLNITPY